MEYEIDTDSLDVYRTVLRHIVRPDDAHDRNESNHYTVEDFDALAIAAALREYAVYSAPDEVHERIALGYIEYIDLVVRDEGRRHVDLFAHTSEADDVLFDALSQTTYLQVQHVESIKAAMY